MTTLIKYKLFCQQNNLVESNFKNLKYFMEVNKIEY